MAGEMCKKMDATRVWNRTRAMYVACRDEHTKETGKPHIFGRLCTSQANLARVCKDVVLESTQCKGAGSSFAEGLNTESDARDCAHSLNLLAKGGRQFEAKMTEHKWLRPNVWTVVVKK